MRISTGKIHGGTVQFDAHDLPDGTKVTMLAQEGDESFELGPEDEARLLTAIAEANRGETTPAEEVLRQIRRS